MYKNLMSAIGPDSWSDDFDHSEFYKIDPGGENYSHWSKDYQPGYMFRNLGNKNLKYLGNLKFNHTHNSRFKEINKRYFKNKIVLCSASTHHNEEEIFANLHVNLKKKIPNLITIIIPRHIELSLIHI